MCTKLLHNAINVFRWTNVSRSAPLITVCPQFKIFSTRSEIEKKLEERFEEYKTENPAPLFRDFTTYKKSLPVRHIMLGVKEEEWIKLHELPYFGSNEDVKFMASQLCAKPPSPIRDLVKYVCAPPASGKTMSILPAFLESDFTHYLYLAFDNNKSRQFKLSPTMPDDDTDVAQRQGAVFAYECVRTLLEEPENEGPYRIRIEPDGVIDEAQSQECLEKLLSSYFGEENNVLFHVDEHHKMCKRTDSNDDTGAWFSRGVMHALARVGTVVSTYLEPLDSIPAFLSSELCRVPVLLPNIDIERIFDYLDLVLPRAKNRTHKRLLAMLKLRIAMTLQPFAKAGNSTSDMDLHVGSIHRIQTSPKLQDFINELATTLGNKQGLEVEQLLKKCIRICRIPKSTLANKSEHATRLLLGMTDDQVEDVGRGLNHLVVCANETLSTPVLRLLSFTDTNRQLNSIYVKGRDRFKRLFKSTDLLCNHPLEEAYLWTLSCHSAFAEELTFGIYEGQEKKFQIHCTDIQPARIFPKHDIKDCDVSFLDPHIMYYANEPGRGDQNHSHPHADMFFRTSDDELVLIEITGGAKPSAVENKIKNLEETILFMQPHLRMGE